MRRVYDGAKTPLQRLVLSGIVPAESQQQLCGVVQALDPLGLLEHPEHLQQALWRCAVNTSPLTQSASASSLQHFCVQGCMQGTLPPQEKVPALAAVLQRLPGEPPDDMGLLD